MTAFKNRNRKSHWLRWLLCFLFGESDKKGERHDIKRILLAFENLRLSLAFSEYTSK